MKRLCHWIFDVWIYCVSDYWAEVVIPSLLFGLVTGAAVFVLLTAAR